MEGRAQPQSVRPPVFPLKVASCRAICPTFAFAHHSLSGLFFLYPFALVAIDSVSVGGEWSLGNFAKMTAHWKFETAFRNTMLLAALVVPIHLAMASVVTKLQRGRSAVLYDFAIPLGISGLAAGLIWLAIREQTGFLNSVLHGLGVIEVPVLFLSCPNTWVILLGIVLAEVWRATAIKMVILVAGIGLIPKKSCEVAEVSGDTRWQRFTRVTLPLLRPSLQFMVLLGASGCGKSTLLRMEMQARSCRRQIRCRSTATPPRVLWAVSTATCR